MVVFPPSTRNFEAPVNELAKAAGNELKVVHYDSHERGGAC